MDVFRALELSVETVMDHMQKREMLQYTIFTTTGLWATDFKMLYNTTITKQKPNTT